jgi:galactose mutarotase-like enzyme
MHVGRMYVPFRSVAERDFQVQTWVLTDLAADVWVDEFRITCEDLPRRFSSPWRIEKRTLRGGRRDGVDLIQVDNGALSFAILPTRGMGLWRGEYHGLPLGWRPPVLGPVHPRFVNLLDRGGLGWLDGFDEWVCRCGLSSNGPPGVDPRTNEFLPLHGRIANLPAHYVEVRVDLDDPHELRVTGQVDEATFFFSHLRLTTTYTTTVGSNQLIVQDVIENLKSSPTELELLYHCQFGPPFLEQGSRIRAPIREVAPRDARAASAAQSLEMCQGPTAGFAEQVFYHDLLADSHDQTLVALHNRAADSGVVLRMNCSELPRFIVWKNTAAEQDGYVVGLEPATNFPNLRAFEREQGRVITLPPGGRHVTTLTIEVHDSAAGLMPALQEIEKLQKQVKPMIHTTPRTGWSI